MTAGGLGLRHDRLLECLCWTLKLILRASCWFITLGYDGWWPQAVALQASGQPTLDLEVFEDADCLEDSRSGVLLGLMHEFCNVLEDVFEVEPQPGAETRLKDWTAGNGMLLLQVAGSVFARPYCEPGKVASAVASCLLLSVDSRDNKTQKEVFSCAEEVQTMLLETAPGEKNPFDTRLHVFLRSPWPAFRLLNALVQMSPKHDSAAEMDLGRCRKDEDWLGSAIDSDWPWFKKTLSSSLRMSTRDPTLFVLDPADGPLSEQYRARWARLYKNSAFREAAAFSSSTFYKFRRHQWQAGCHPGIVSAYIMQVVTFCIRDSEAWLQRYVGAAWRLLNVMTPLTSLMQTDWPIFHALHVGSLLRRHIGRSPSIEWPRGPRQHKTVSGAWSLKETVQSLVDESSSAVYLTAAWGALARFLAPFLTRWIALALPMLIVLTVDDEADSACNLHSRRKATIACISLAADSGMEATIAKYIALASIANSGVLAVWLDLDVYLPTDPTPKLEAALRQADLPPLALAGFLNSRSMSPSVLAAVGSDAPPLLLEYAAWLYEHPYIQDHQGWDGFLRNPHGDFSGGWDYKGRNHSTNPDDGLHRSFMPPPEVTVLRKGAQRYLILGRDFASGDGWIGDADDLASFHFWGADVSQEELFAAFYPFTDKGFSNTGQQMLFRFHKAPASSPSVVTSSMVQQLHLTGISYAHGCCAKALQRNRDTALAVGMDQVFAYGQQDLDPDWAARHASVLRQKKGGGWWLWKPHVILWTLLSETVPWHTGVVLWLDAGNHYVGDPRSLAANVLLKSDVAAMSLKCCIESDWTTMRALQKLKGDGYAISDRPQLGAYFILFRKTKTTLSFVEDWLRFSEDPDILLDSPQSTTEAPGFQRHMADQSIFSVLFKQRGFQAMPLEEGHRVVQLDRWRE